MRRTTPHREISAEEMDRITREHIDFYAKRGINITASASPEPNIDLERTKIKASRTRSS